MVPQTAWRTDRMKDMTYTQFWHLVRERRVDKVGSFLGQIDRPYIYNNVPHRLKHSASCLYAHFCSRATSFVAISVQYCQGGVV